MPTPTGDMMEDEPCRARSWRVGTSRLVETGEYGAMVGLFADVASARTLGLIWLSPEEARDMALWLLQAADRGAGKNIPLPLDAEEKEGA